MAFDKDGFPVQLSKRVAELEKHTSAEVVVLLKQASGNYRDVDLAWGFVAAFASLAIIIHAEPFFHPDWVLVDLVVSVGVATFLSSRIGWLRRLFSGAERRRQQVAEVARSLFVEHGLDQTSERTGILIFVSVLERRLQVVADLGVREALSPAVFEHWHTQWGQAQSPTQLENHLYALLDSMEGTLSRQLPIREGDRNELPDAPVEVA